MLFGKQPEKMSEAEIASELSSAGQYRFIIVDPDPEPIVVIETCRADDADTYDHQLLAMQAGISPERAKFGYLARTPMTDNALTVSGGSLGETLKPATQEQLEVALRDGRTVLTEGKFKSRWNK